MRRLLTLVLAVATISVFANSQVNCTFGPPGTTKVRSEGKAELVDDVVLTCTSGAPQSLLVDVTLFLSVNASSRITGPGQLTDTLLLIDEPQPGVANTSNNFPYFGQVPGTSGIYAGNPGSGNVYQGTLLNGNEVQWAQIPFETNGTRTLRITNIRGNANAVGNGFPINAFVAINGPAVFNILPSNATQVAFVRDGLNFTTVPPTAASGGLKLSFREVFANAFKKRIENTSGPLTARYQDIPGQNHCTESGFTPEYSSLTPNAIGSATTGTRLLANFENVPPSVIFLIVPNEVNSTTGQLVAHRVLPPLAADFTGGTVLTIPGFSLVLVSAAHTADVLYEVTAAAPYNGVNGCGKLDSFSVDVFPFFPNSLQTAKISGHFAPDDPNPQASATAPTPRFVP